MKAPVVEQETGAFAISCYLKRKRSKFPNRILELNLENRMPFSSGHSPEKRDFSAFSK